ncbi:hypothetical protein DICVIV_11038 [Dictyocaulus viviparus]|uniref:Uncharacterized protein n=1 Tax=Dictyocaulus viviparus TaxID=29172 RepID=A0A0D8XE87_DICVI|nr:hypothetical protein DICVIV_11038 [Dictyocaulus viviparus]
MAKNNDRKNTKSHFNSNRKWPSEYLDGMSSPLACKENLDSIHRQRRYSSGARFNSNKEIGGYSNRYPNSQIVQEVAISYSAPLTVSAPTSPMSLPLHNSDRTLNVAYLNAQNFQFDQLHRSTPVITPESLERVNNFGRHETEFPVRIAYIGGESVSPAHSTLPSSLREPIVDSRASTRLAGSMVSETTTVQELTTITTTSRARSVSSSEMPGVSELAQRFERVSRSDSSETDRAAQKPASRVVVVSKPGPEYFYSSDESRIRHIERPTYSPSDEKSILSTTVVDIEPQNYCSTPPRYVEERYQLEEKYRSVKSYTSPTDSIYKSKEVIIPTVDKKESTKESFTGHTVFSSREHQYDQELSEIYSSTPVRSVVEQFESKIEEGRRTPDRKPYHYKEKLEAINVCDRRAPITDYREKEVYIPRSDLRPLRKTYTESITTSRKTVGSDVESPYKEKTREVRREELDRYHSSTERQMISPPPTKLKEEKKGIIKESTTEYVRDSSRVDVPKPRSPSPVKVKSTTEINKEELKEDKRKKSDERPTDFYRTSTQSYDYKKTEKTDETKTTTTKRYDDTVCI